MASAELQWVLQQMEETVRTRGCWSTDAPDAHSATLNPWGLNAMVAMMWPRYTGPKPVDDSLPPEA